MGFEPTQLALVELESTPLDHSGKVSWALPAQDVCIAPSATSARKFALSECDVSGVVVGVRQFGGVVWRRRITSMSTSCQSDNIHLARIELATFSV